jgi:hypothetical protein
MTIPAPNDFLGRLLEQWRGEAAVLRRHGAHEAAETKDADIRDLQERYLEFQLEELTLAEGAEWSGLSYDGLRKKVSRGEILNVGDSQPRVRRCDLPRKPTGPPMEPEDLGSIADRIQAARRGA